MESATSIEFEPEMEFDEAIERAGMQEDKRDRERSLSPRERFYGVCLCVCMYMKYIYMNLCMFVCMHICIFMYNMYVYNCVYICVYI